MANLLDDDCIDEKLQTLSGWTRIGAHIERNYEVSNFDRALALVNEIAGIARELDHHPDIFLHDYNQVRITSTTHSAKGITDNDIELATRINALNVCE